MTFAEMVRGKSVAVVGGSNLLEGIGQGEYIDSHDVVLRVNLHWPCPIFLEDQRDLSVDIGQRTDIVFQAVSAWRPGRFHQMDIKLVIIRGNDRFVQDFLSHDTPTHWLHPMFLQILDDCEQRGTAVEYFSPKYDHIYPEWNPNTGLLALKTVMYEEPSKVYVAGFDFSVFHNRVVNWYHHDPLKDRQYFRNHIATDPRVEMHPIVRKAVESDYVHPTFSPQIKMI